MFKEIKKLTSIGEINFLKARVSIWVSLGLGLVLGLVLGLMPSSDLVFVKYRPLIFMCPKADLSRF